MDTSTHDRLHLVEAGIRMTLDHPVLGVGFGQSSRHWQRYKAAEIVSTDDIELHNSFIAVSAQTGLLGLIPFMALVVLSLRIGYHLRKAHVPEDGPIESAVRRSLFPAMAGFLVAAFFITECWGYFMFIMFAQAATMHEIWKLKLGAFRMGATVGTQHA